MHGQRPGRSDCELRIPHCRTGVTTTTTMTTITSCAFQTELIFGIDFGVGGLVCVGAVWGTLLVYHRKSRGLGREASNVCMVASSASLSQAQGCQLCDGCIGFALVCLWGLLGLVCKYKQYAYL